MKRIVLLIWCMNLLPFYVLAQQAAPAQAPQPWRLGWGAELGLLAGAEEPGLEGRATVGLRHGGWLLGLAAGYDSYRYASVPLGLQVRKHFARGLARPYVLAAGGANLPAVAASQKRYYYDGIPDGIIGIWPVAALPMQYSMGWYAEAGAGVAILNKKQRGFTMALVLTRKTMTEWYEQRSYMMPGQMDRTTNRYQMQRLGLRLGYLF